MPTRTAPTLASAIRINQSLTAAAEKRALLWLAARAPTWLTSDHLTLLGLAAQLAAGAAFALARLHPYTLVAVFPATLLNWLGDSLDGTLARVRHHERPRFGFYADHVVDLLGALALLAGLALSGLIHPLVAAAMLVGFLLLSAESYLATYALGRFHLSQGLFGPTELRLLLLLGTARLLHNPYVTVHSHRLLLFDLGGTLASLLMLAVFLRLASRHTAELYRQEPLP